MWWASVAWTRERVVIKTHWLWVILEETHGIFNDHFILETNECHNLLRYPWPDDVQVDFADIHLSLSVSFRYNRVPYVPIRIGNKICTFLSNSGGNLSVFRSLTSLSENRLSWSAEVPLKNPVEELVNTKAWITFSCTNRRLPFIWKCTTLNLKAWFEATSFWRVLILFKNRGKFRVPETSVNGWGLNVRRMCT